MWWKEFDECGQEIPCLTLSFFAVCTHFNPTGQTDRVWSLPLRRVSGKSQTWLLLRTADWSWLRCAKGKWRDEDKPVRLLHGIHGDYTPHRESGFKKARRELVMLCLLRNQQETNTGWSLCFICSCRGSNELCFPAVMNDDLQESLLKLSNQICMRWTFHVSPGGQAEREEALCSCKWLNELSSSSSCVIILNTSAPSDPAAPL